MVETPVILVTETSSNDNVDKISYQIARKSSSDSSYSSKQEDDIISSAGKHYELLLLLTPSLHINYDLKPDVSYAGVSDHDHCVYFSVICLNHKNQIFNVLALLRGSV